MVVIPWAAWLVLALTCRGATSGKVLTGADMRAMGMPDLAGLADGDLSPGSLAALERHGVQDPAIKDIAGRKTSPGSESKSSPGTSGVQGAQFTPQGGGMSAMSMATLSEEESVGSGVPDSMRCDACNAIAYQLRQGLVSAENKISGKRLSEIIVVDALEAVCAGRLQPKTLGTGDNYRTVEQDWGEYCIKEIETDGEAGKVVKVNRMAGPGCPIEDQSGYAQFGMMKTRLEKKCFELLGEHGEDEIYGYYLENAKESAELSLLVCKADCNDSQQQQQQQQHRRRKKKTKKSKRDVKHAVVDDVTTLQDRANKRRASAAKLAEPVASLSGTSIDTVDAPAVPNTDLSGERRDGGRRIARVVAELKQVRVEIARLHAEELTLLSEVAEIMLNLE